MSEHRATIKWTMSQGEFIKGSYSREHTWTFDGGVTVPASPAPTSVKPPYSNAANVDPEEAYVAAISSCHMLTFLWVASRQGLEVTSYVDEAVGVMTKNERGIPGSAPSSFILGWPTRVRIPRRRPRRSSITRRMNRVTSPIR